MASGNGEAGTARVVTRASLRAARPATPPVAGTESALGGKAGAALDEYEGLVAILAREAAEIGDGLFFTVRDGAASRLQSRLAEEAGPGRVLAAGGLEATFGDGIGGGDWWGWLGSLLDHVRQADWHAIVRPAGFDAAPLPDEARIAVLSDWGTGLYGAPVSAASIRRQGPFDLLLHLGDIYYSGTRTEVRQRFLDPWPGGAAAISRALNGNHEMYSGGFGYFDDLLPAFGQASSYFAFANRHWLLVGLDTAHSDHDIDPAQAAWVAEVAAKAGGRRIVLFSHHQPVSRLGEGGPKLVAALSGLLEAGAITAWYWGHEHECILYDRHPRWGLLGRCVGHGGIPSPRKEVVRAAPAAVARDGIAWKRLAAGPDAPASLVLDGPNPWIRGEEERFGPHGYLTLEFKGPRLVERIHLPDGAEIFRNELG